jgi:excisionase family DNA binding protein
MAIIGAALGFPVSINMTEITPIASPDILDVEDLAALLRLHPTTIRAHAAQGLIPGRQIGNRGRFKRTTIEAWLSENDTAA